MSLTAEAALDVLLEQVHLGACPVCGAVGSRPWKTLKSWNLDKCRGCGMIYVNPCPTDEALQAAYSLSEEGYNEFFQTHYIDSQRILGGNGDWQRRKNHERLDAIERKTNHKGRILEVGCGAGVFLQTAKSRGWETMGVDPGDWRQGYDKDDELGIRRCSLFEAGFREDSFDVIYMGSVLEHLFDPRRYLETLYSLLKPGGLIYVTGLPNIRSWTIRLGIDHWIGNHPPLHLLFFSRRTARLIFENVGFSQITIRCYGMSETVMEAIFNRSGKPYSGDYAGRFFEPTPKGTLLRYIRRFINGILDLTDAGSVLEIFAIRPFGETPLH